MHVKYLFTKHTGIGVNDEHPQRALMFFLIAFAAAAVMMAIIRGCK